MLMDEVGSDLDILYDGFQGVTRYVCHLSWQSVQNQFNQEIQEVPCTGTYSTLLYNGNPLMCVMISYGKDCTVFTESVIDCFNPPYGTYD